MKTNTLFVVHRKQLMQCEIISNQVDLLGEDDVLLSVDRFGLTSNNITYASLDGILPYFDFFPVGKDWSALPVWGVATVIQSSSPSVKNGDRFYGFFPAAEFALLKVAEATPTGFRCSRPHLSEEFAFYNLYHNLQHDPFYISDRESFSIAMRPQLLTGLQLHDYLKVHDWKGADRVLVSSAASKTAFGLAASLQLSGGNRVIGLASHKSKSFAEKMGVYDKVYSYKEISELSIYPSFVYVDFSGDPSIRERLSNLPGANLIHILSVGLTHWDTLGHASMSPSKNIKTEQFFSPAWAMKRGKEAGTDHLKQLVTDWHSLIKMAQNAFRCIEKTGDSELRESFLMLSRGEAEPDEIWVHTLKSCPATTKGDRVS